MITSTPTNLAILVTEMNVIWALRCDIDVFGDLYDRALHVFKRLEQPTEDAQYAEFFTFASAFDDYHL